MLPLLLLLDDWASTNDDADASTSIKIRQEMLGSEKVWRRRRGESPSADIDIVEQVPQLLVLSKSLEDTIIDWHLQAKEN